NANRIRNTSAAEHTSSENRSSEILMFEKLDRIAQAVSKRSIKSNVSAKTVTLKIKYSDFTLQTRSKTLPYFISDTDVILDVAKVLLFQEKVSDSVRLLGISMSNLNTESTNKKPSKPESKSVSVQLQFEF